MERSPYRTFHFLFCCSIDRDVKRQLFSWTGICMVGSIFCWSWPRNRGDATQWRRVGGLPPWCKLLLPCSRPIHFHSVPDQGAAQAGKPSTEPTINKSIQYNTLNSRQRESQKHPTYNKPNKHGIKRKNSDHVRTQNFAAAIIQKLYNCLTSQLKHSPFEHRLYWTRWKAISSLSLPTLPHR